jgi:hypothetical protein
MSAENAQQSPPMDGSRAKTPDADLFAGLMGLVQEEARLRGRTNNAGRGGSLEIEAQEGSSPSMWMPKLYRFKHWSHP